MKFDLLPSLSKTKFGETEGYLKKVDFSNDQNVQYKLSFKCSIGTYSENIGKPLIVEWSYSMGYDDIPFYQIGTSIYYKVFEIEIPSKDKDLQKIIFETHEILCNTFKEKKDKLNTIRPVDKLTDYTIQQSSLTLNDELIQLQA